MIFYLKLIIEIPNLGNNKKRFGSLIVLFVTIFFGKNFIKKWKSRKELKKEEDYEPIKGKNQNLKPKEVILKEKEIKPDAEMKEQVEKEDIEIKSDAKVKQQEIKPETKVENKDKQEDVEIKLNIGKNLKNKVFLDSEIVINKLREINETKKYYENILNKRAFFELDHKEKGVYVVGDLDGDEIREILAAIISGHLQITQKGLNILIALIIKINEIKDLKLWQGNEEVFQKFDEILEEIKTLDSNNQLIFLGDCVFDRFSNNILSLLNLQEKLKEKGVIHILGNHDIIENAYLWIFQVDGQFAEYIPEDKKIDKKILKEKIDKIYNNCYFDKDNNIFYIHNGICAWRIYKENFLNNIKEIILNKTCEIDNSKNLVTPFGIFIKDEKYESINEKINNYIQCKIAESKDNEKDLVATAFGIFQANNTTELMEKINKTEPVEKDKSKYFFVGKTKKGYSTVWELCGMTSVRIPDRNQFFEKFPNILIVHGHDGDFNTNILKEKSQNLENLRKNIKEIVQSEQEKDIKAYIIQNRLLSNEKINNFTKIDNLALNEIGELLKNKKWQEEEFPVTLDDIKNKLQGNQVLGLNARLNHEFKAIMSVITINK